MPCVYWSVKVSVTDRPSPDNAALLMPMPPLPGLRNTKSPGCTVLGFSASLKVTVQVLKGDTDCTSGFCETTRGPVLSMTKLPLCARLPVPCRSSRPPPSSV